MRKKGVRKRSPLKTAPFRQAGQSLGEELEKLFFQKSMGWYVVVMFSVLLAALEWWRWWWKRPPQPILVTIVAVVTCGVAGWRIYVLISQSHNMVLGLQGEKVVGQCLEELRSQGYQIFHDIPGDGFNVDHVLVGAGGVFVIETKTRMKPTGRQSEVLYDGKTLTVDGFRPDRDPIVQVLAASREVKRIIKEGTGNEVYVRPVVVFPGWFTRQPKGSEVWVLNETTFPKWVAGAKSIFDDVTVHQIASAIGMHVRNAQGAS